MDARTNALLEQMARSRASDRSGSGGRRSAFELGGQGVFSPPSGDRDAAYWPESTNIVVAAAATWTTPASRYLDARGAVAAFATVTVLSISGGAVDIALQACPARSEDDNAWKTIASSTGISTAGPKILKCNRLSSEVVTGWLRVRITGASGTTTLNIRGEILLKQIEAYDAGDWFEALSISLTGSTNWTMPLDWMLDGSRFLSAYVLLSYSGSDGSNVTASLLTAPGISTDANLYKTVATTTLGTSVQLLDGRSTLTNPPMGVLRLKLAHSGGGTADGVVRAQYLLKEV